MAVSSEYSVAESERILAISRSF